MTKAYDDCGNNSDYAWAYLAYGPHRPGLWWNVVGFGPFTASGFAVVDDFGTLVPVK